MAKLRDIKRRIKSVKNTAKITRTMELIATAKAKTAQDRIQRALPYFEALAEIAGQARKASGEDVGPVHPLLERREVKKVAILVVVGNRGLCGGYNTNVLRMARDHRARLLAEGKEVRLFASGKKGFGWLKFQKVPFEGSYTQFDDKPKFVDVERVADTLIGLFQAGEVDRVDVCYTHYFSAGRQAPVVETMLPITSAAEAQVASRGEKPAAPSGPGAGGAAPEKAGRNVVFTIEPDPKTILDAIFPLQARLHLFRVYLESASSEQIARRVAMKNATDNAQEVGRLLKMAYNRGRQSQITKEILEVLGGAEALA
ncbi:MAG: ATP synthase F1 subunit gamma [Planctomycetota bacterium]|nr:ATP synthase F1 subunit gamma [Planctomycetota bacterium]